MINNKVLAEILRLNNNAVPAVNALNMKQLEIFVERADFYYYHNIAGRVASFMLGFSHMSSHDGYNFNWFKSKYRDFFYIDRLIVSEPLRNYGYGQDIYKRTVRWCVKNNLSKLCCEVNSDPPNPVSHRFHRKIGFAAVAVIPHPEGKEVTMYLAETENLRHYFGPNFPDNFPAR